MGKKIGLIDNLTSFTLIMLELNFDPFPILTTNRLVLRKITEEDADPVFFLRSNKEVLRFLDRDPIRSIDDSHQWIRMIDAGVRSNQFIAWAMSLKNETQLIGTISFWNIQKEHYRSEIGYALHPLHQGKGLMQEAMTVVINYGFTVMKLHSIEANVNPQNMSSIKLLERNEFVREAYHKENYFYNGKFLDSAIYSLITPH